MTVPLLSGFGWFQWILSECGAPQEIADLALVNGCSHLLPKIADGEADYNKGDGDLARRLTAAAQLLGIDVWGWQYVYLRNPKAEADKAVQRIHETGCTGFVIDAEGEWKNNSAKAVEYCLRLRSQLGNDFPIALSSYRYPSYHPEFPWAAVRPYVNMDMPQVYWEQVHNPVEQLTKSYNEFANMTPRLPYLPTGAAYKWDGWRPTVEDISGFIGCAKSLNLPGFNFWSYQHCKRDLPEIWQQIMPNADNPDIPEIIKAHNPGGYVNIRYGPGYGYTITGKAPHGLELHVTGISDYREWYKCGTGWINANWCKVVE